MISDKMRHVFATVSYRNLEIIVFFLHFHAFFEVFRFEENFIFRE